MPDAPLPAFDPATLAETLAARDRALAQAQAARDAARAEVARLTRALAQAEAERQAVQTRAMRIEAEIEARLVPLQAQARAGLERAAADDRALRRAAIRARDHAIDETQEARAAIAADLARERSARLRAEAQIARMRASSSWRVSAPLRWLGRALGRG
jgi:hypothetical protein